VQPRNSVIVVEQSFSWCSACGKRVVVEQSHHVDIGGDYRLIDPGKVINGGCGAKFVAITSGTAFYTSEDLYEVREGLPAIPADVVRFA
jgi:hypothetical protein